MCTINFPCGIHSLSVDAPETWLYCGGVDGIIYRVGLLGGVRCNAGDEVDVNDPFSFLVSLSLISSRILVTRTSFSVHMMCDVSRATPCRDTSELWLRSKGKRKEEHEAKGFFRKGLT